MADKTTFAPEEWALLLRSVMTAGLAVSMADPSGLWGLLKEGVASAGALVEAKVDPRADALVKAVIGDFDTAAGRGAARDDLKAQFAGSKPAEVKQKCIETLRRVSALLDAKAPDDAAAFKGWLRHISQRVAEAANEGGFLGIGGIQVSEAEKATLAEISNALSLPA
jgi:hypothetical protein